VRFSRENRSWGYNRIAGALANVGREVSDQTVGNVLKRHGVSPAPDRKRTTTWSEFIRSHMDVLAATDFFTTEVSTKSGLATYYVLFVIRLANRQIYVAGLTPQPDEVWMTQIARNVTFVDEGFLSSSRYLLHECDTKFCSAFVKPIESAGVRSVKLPARSPNLNAFAKRWVRSVKEECLSKLIFFGEESLRRALVQYQAHHHSERPRQGKENVILLPSSEENADDGPLQCRERLGGLLKYYNREAG